MVCYPVAPKGPPLVGPSPTSAAIASTCLPAAETSLSPVAILTLSISSLLVVVVVVQTRSEVLAGEVLADG